MAKITAIMLLQQPEQFALTIETQTNMSGIPQAIGSSFMRIGAYLEELGELPADIPFVEYPVCEELTEGAIKMTVGFYTAGLLPSKNDIQSTVIPARKTVVCLHKGSYDELAGLYNEMAEWIKGKGYEPVGTSIEHYYTGSEIPEEEQITRIVMPLK